jgi:asparagine synthase (glutamine-hydrolysing)
VEYVARIPFNTRSKKSEPKYILKKTLNRILPEEIIQRPKAGFSLPINRWLHGELHVLIDLLLSEKRLAQQEYFNNQYVKDLINKFNNGDNTFQEDDYRIWNLIMYQLWHMIFIENNSYSLQDVKSF